MHISRLHYFRAMFAAAAGVAILLAGACSENSGTTVRETPAEGRTTDAGQGVTLSLNAQEFSFNPNRIEMRPNQTASIKVTNTGTEKHSFKIYEDASHEEPVSGAELQAMDPGKSETLTFKPDPAIHKFYFRCEIHHQMNGELEVGPQTGG
jgi:plastocyanin